MPTRLRLAFLIALLTATGSGCSSADDTTPPVVSTATAAAVETTTPTRLHGIDVSHFQGDVDWAAVAASGKAFAIVKATEGIDYVDPSFETHWQGVRQHGLVRGAYHFYVADDDAKTQADFFLATVSFEDGDLIPVLDVETRGQVPSDELIAGVKIWLDRVEAALDHRPMIYTDTNFWNSLDTDAFGHHPLWVAEYSPDGPLLPDGWKQWQLWQFTQDGKVSGVSGDVDLSAFEGSLEELKQQLTLSMEAK